VDDIVQDVFLAAMQRSRSFRGHSSLGTWLTVITLNRCRTHRRKLRSLWRLHVRLSGTPPDSAASADQAPAQDDASLAVRAAVAALPPRDREVIVLHYLENKPVGEISQLLNVSANAVDVRLHRARKRLKPALAALGEGPRE